MVRFGDACSPKGLWSPRLPCLADRGGWIESVGGFEPEHARTFSGFAVRLLPGPQAGQVAPGVDVLNRCQIMYANGYMTTRSNQRQALSRAKVEAANGRFFITEVD